MDQIARIRSGLDQLLGLSAEDRARLDHEFGWFLDGEIRIGPRRSPDEIRVFEVSIGSALPADYARFLQEIGDGHVGPGRTFHTLAESRQHRHPDLPFDVAHPIVDDPSGSFPSEIAVVDRVSDVWAGNGVIELADYGCGMSSVLIVNGVRSGEVWFHEPSVEALTPWCYWSALHGRIEDLNGAVESRFQPPRRYGFLDWYEEWLTALLRG